MTLLARDIMQTNVVTVAADMPLSDLADLFLRERIGGAPVIEADRPGAVIGIISRTDLMRFPLYQGAVSGILGEYLRALDAGDGDDSPAPMPRPIVGELSAHTVREAMAAEPFTVAATTPVREVAQAMVAQHLHRVLVTDNSGLVGLISSLDIVRLVADGADL